jgi:pimeloyl-ACP methyl ester carboxylesterase
MRGYVDCDWGQLHYRKEGAAGPTLVLFHESPRSSMVFRSVLPMLAQRTIAYAFDTPGYGMSDLPDDLPPFEDYIPQFLQGIDALGIEEFIPVGMKTGSRIATELALLAGPSRVPKAVLFGPDAPPVVTEVDGMPMAQYMRTAWAPPIQYAADGSHLMTLWKKNVGIYDAESLEDLTAAVGEVLVNADGDRFSSAYRALFASTRAPVEDPYGTLMRAGCDLMFFRPSFARLRPDVPTPTLDELPGARIVTFDISGHFATRQPERFASEIFDFIGV